MDAKEKIDSFLNEKQGPRAKTFEEFWKKWMPVDWPPAGPTPGQKKEYMNDLKEVAKNSDMVEMAYEEGWDDAIGMITDKMDPDDIPGDFIRNEKKYKENHWNEFARHNKIER